MAQKGSKKVLPPVPEVRPPWRPTVYNPIYCEMIVEFFDKETVEERTITTTAKGDFHKEEPKLMPKPLPTLERFAFDIGATTTMLVEWAKKYPDFQTAYMRAKNLQKNGLVQGGLMGVYPSNFATFVAKNFTDMEDKTKTEHTGKMSLTEFLSDESNRPPKDADSDHHS